jgi:hypothetical protein
MQDVDKDRGIKIGEERIIQALFKCVCGYWNGSTMQQFMRDLGFAELVDDPEGGNRINTPTDFGKSFLYHYHAKDKHCCDARFVLEKE